MSKFKTVDQAKAHLACENLSFKRHTDRKANPYVTFYDASGNEVAKEFVTSMGPDEIKALVSKAMAPSQ